MEGYLVFRRILINSRGIQRHGRVSAVKGRFGTEVQYLFLWPNSVTLRAF